MSVQQSPTHAPTLARAHTPQARERADREAQEAREEREAREARHREELERERERRLANDSHQAQVTRE